MSVNPQENVQEIVATEQPRNDKEYNFSRIKQQLEAERSEKARLAQEVAELKSKMTQKPAEDEESYEEPYIDKKFFKKSMAQSMQQVKEEAKREAMADLQRVMVEEKRNSWLKSNPDFNEVMQHAQKFAEADPELAETILEMPEGFERQKLVYKNIKALGLHKPVVKETIQDKVDKNRRGPYYQPSNMGSAPYAGGGDFSPAGQKNAYDQMKALQSRMKLG